MMTQRMIVWILIALVAGIGLGFGFRTPIGNALNLNADQAAENPLSGWIPPPAPSADEILCLQKGGIWTGNGCAKPWLWTKGDWSFFQACLNVALRDGTITEAEYIACVKQTESGKGRK